MSRKLTASALAILLFAPHLLAGGSSPAIKVAVAPKYPTLTLAGRDGQVTIRAIIGPAGNVKNVRVTDGHPMLKEAAADAAKQWKFEESSVQERVATLKFNFVILPENSKVASQTVSLPPTGVEIRQKPEAAPGQTAAENPAGKARPDQHLVSRI